MAKLAILGHATRGKEVIEILEMLGGVNTYAVSADEEELPFTIRDDDSIMVACYPTGEFVIYTLEEFLEKFPYKVGDKAKLDGWPCIITEMSWGYDDVVYSVKGVDFSKRVFSKDLQPYKEENMEEKKINQMSLANCELDEVEIVLGDKFELKIKEGKYYAVKKQPKYPKTYKECCDVLGLSTMDNDAQGYKVDLIIRFQELLIARDAYWKIAGEEMGLDKPWEPDWNKSSQFKNVIICRSNNIIKYACATINTILAFPTEEMRDAFYGNFKDLIEECKEFL